MKKRFLAFVVMPCVVCMNFALADLVSNGDFESPVIPVNTAIGGQDCLGDTWNVGDGWGLWYPAAITAPLSGQVLYDNAANNLMQTFTGVKLLPNRVYILTFDAYTTANGPHGISAGLYHGMNSGSNSAIVAVLDIGDIASATVSNGTWYGAGWPGGALFTTTVNPPANDASIYHELKIETAATISGPNSGGDIGIILWGGGGVQLAIDNVKVEVIPEPAVLGFLGLLGVAFLRRK